MTGTWDRRRVLYSVAAGVAGGVAVLFSTVGDGVAVPGATGPARLVVDLGHQTVWALLSAAFGVAAVRGRWGRASEVLAVGAGVAYVAFLAVVLIAGG